MKNITFPFRSLLAISTVAMLSLTSCKSYFIASDFDDRTRDDKTIAILPFEMVFTGKIPENLTEDDIANMNEQDSKSFMVSFYNETLASTKRGRKQMRVSVQHYDKTLSILEQNNIDVRTSWSEDPQKLADMLGVDAVVKGRIQKHRFMSDMASYGISTGVKVITVATGADPWNWIPMNVTTAKEIQSNYTLVDADGTALWSIGYDYDADYRQSAEDVVECINEKSVKHFPYRKRA